MNIHAWTGDRPWAALHLLAVPNATVRLQWADRPSSWRAGDAAELFIVLDGEVDMRYRELGAERVERLTPGRLCVVEAGDEHAPHPLGPARMLVIQPVPPPT